jgi:hypothetical protein
VMVLSATCCSVAMALSSFSRFSFFFLELK